jgi:competence protein ComGC
LPEVVSGQNETVKNKGNEETEKMINSRREDIA